MFVVFEGIDQSGKSTQVELLKDACLRSAAAHKIQAEVFSFPTRIGPIGELIDLYLKKKILLCDQAIHLLFSSDRWEMKNKLENSILNNKLVIADRYIYSGIAYSVAKGLDIRWCEKSDEGLPIPDLVIYMKSERYLNGPEVFETKLFQEKVSKAYEQIKKTSYGDKTVWLELDSKDSPLNLHNKIFTTVYQYLK